MALLGAQLGDRRRRTARARRASVPHMDRRADPGGRRDVASDRLEQLADEPLGRVGDEPDPAARAGRPGRARSRSAPGPARTSRRRRSVTTSKLPSPNGSASASPSTNSTSRPSASARAPRALEQRRDVVDADDRRSRAARRRSPRCRCRSRRRGRARSNGRRGPRSAAPRRSGSASRSCGSRRSPRSPAGALDRGQVRWCRHHGHLSLLDGDGGGDGGRSWVVG